MALSVLQYGSDQFPVNSGTGATELSSNATIGHTILACIQTNGSTLNDVTLTSNYTGTFTRINSIASPNALDMEWFYATATSAHNQLTVTLGVATTWWAAVWEIAGAVSSVITGGTSTEAIYTPVTLTVTPSESGDIIFEAVYCNGSPTINSYPGAPWTDLGGLGQWSYSKGADAVWQIVTSTSPVSGTWGNAGFQSSNASGVIVRPTSTPVTYPSDSINPTIQL